mmetsp:Transcript_794/g.2446  ORF Transcript_794/g.2446 Transcript_794/m.2446 type:complete len:279 (+) Transcript_794:3903-4739(+)
MPDRLGLQRLQGLGMGSLPLSDPQDQQCWQIEVLRPGQRLQRPPAGGRAGATAPCNPARPPLHREALRSHPSHQPRCHRRHHCRRPSHRCRSYQQHRSCHNHHQFRCCCSHRRFYNPRVVIDGLVAFVGVGVGAVIQSAATWPASGDPLAQTPTPSPAACLRVSKCVTGTAACAGGAAHSRCGVAPRCTALRHTRIPCTEAGTHPQPPHLLAQSPLRQAGGGGQQRGWPDLCFGPRPASLRPAVPGSTSHCRSLHRRLHPQPQTAPGKRVPWATLQTW